MKHIADIPVTGKPMTVFLTKTEIESIVQLMMLGLQASNPIVAQVMQKLAAAAQEASQPPKDE